MDTQLLDYHYSLQNTSLAEGDYTAGWDMLDNARAMRIENGTCINPLTPVNIFMFTSVIFSIAAMFYVNSSSKPIP